MHTLGCHYLLELSGCPEKKLNNRQFVEKVLMDAARAANATVVASTFHTFNPHGLSGVVVIAESHLAIHTWPEFGYAAVDVFTCGGDALPQKAVEHCIREFHPANHAFIEVKRGIMDDRSRTASCLLSISEGRSGST
jgi:S-adenosylmethionine decarboxylase